MEKHDIGSQLPSKFWDDLSAGDQDMELDQDMDDPRKDEDWKIQSRRGFMKDRESKETTAKQSKQTKLSKTAKRNSRESIFELSSKNKKKQVEEKDEGNTFDFLDEINMNYTPVVPMPGTSKVILI